MVIAPETTSRSLNRSILAELVKLHKGSYLGGRTPVYDGRKSLYTAGQLPFTSKDFVVKLEQSDRTANRFVLYIQIKCNLLVYSDANCLILKLMSVTSQNEGERGNLESQLSLRSRETCIIFMSFWQGGNLIHPKKQFRH